MKWVRCLEGKVFDIALDIRLDSPTRFQWFATELSPQNHTMMIIPEGFAHGFQVLEGPARLLYLHTEFYTPEAEGGFHLLDPKLKIQLPCRYRKCPNVTNNTPGFSTNTPTMNCRHCHSPLSLSFADLNTAPPSNAYLKPEDLSSPSLSTLCVPWFAPNVGWFKPRILPPQKMSLLRSMDTSPPCLPAGWSMQKPT